MPLVAPLVALDILTIVLWAIAVALAAALLMRLIAAPVRSIPVIGGQIAGIFDGIANAISNAAGRLFNGLDKLVGAAWHQMARYLDQLWDEQVRVAHGLVTAASSLWHVIHGHRILNHLVHSLLGGAHAFGHAIKTLEREFHGIEHRVKRIEHEIAQGIGNDVRTGLQALRKELRGFERAADNAIANVDTAAQGAISDLRNFLGIRKGLGYLTWAAGIVAAVIGVEAVNLFRCPTWLNRTSKRGCGLWNGLEDLFGLFIDAIALTHLCDLPKWIDELASPFLGELTGLISSAANALCAKPNKDWLYPSVTVPDSTLPPAQHVGQLP